jgi:myo-inositol-1(or 4)-monophosphatase
MSVSPRAPLSAATPSDLAERLEVASAAAREAGALIRDAFQTRAEAGALTLKGHHDYLTMTDAAAEQLVRERFAQAFPNDSFFGEESGGHIGDSVWIADPIDGTANFARGVPHFCTALAYVREGRTEVGVIYDPIRNEMFAAARGQGATMNGRPMQVSGIDDIQRAIVEAGWSTRLPPQPYVSVIDGLLLGGAQVRRAGSGALALAYVADGRIDAYCELHINAWDAIAGLLLVEEAGGWTNDFLADDGLRKGNPVIGCTPQLKDVLREVTGFARWPSRPVA